MKKTEIAMIILIASLSMIGTFFLARAILGDKIKREAQVPVVTEVRDELVKPSKLIFNNKAINPTVEVYIETSAGAGKSDESKPEASSQTQANEEGN